MVEGLYSACGKILNLIWRNFYVFGRPFNAINGQIRKNNLAIWSHWIDVLLRFVCDICSCDPAEHFHCFNVSIFAPLLSHFPTYRLSVEDKWSNASKWRTLSKAARWRLVPSWGLRQLPVWFFEVWYLFTILKVGTYLHWPNTFATEVASFTDKKLQNSQLYLSTFATK